jgi:hypothetical protein
MNGQKNTQSPHFLTIDPLNGAKTFDRLTNLSQQTLPKQDK